MITNLSYTVQFASTGRVLRETINLGTGLTAIVGPNEAGKSFVVEMIRYAFFGVAALRGKKEDYAELHVLLEWKDIKIERTLKGGKVWRAGSVIATGTTAVNAKLIEILGFGLDVFDVACVCNQGDVERLGAMSAGDRKAMVDRVIGSSRIEDIQRWAGEQGNLLVREVAVLERKLIEPIEPVKPDDYQPPIELGDDVAELRALKQDHDELVGWLKVERTLPVAPKPLAATATVEELSEARHYAHEFRRINAIRVVDFNVDEVAKQWAAYDLFMEAVEFPVKHPHADMTREDLNLEMDRRRRSLALEDLRNRRAIMAGDELTCPHCHGSFCVGHERVAELDAQIAALGEPGQALPFAKLSETANMLADWENPETVAAWERLRAVPTTTKPAISREQLRMAQVGGHCSSAERAAMLAQLKPRRPVAEVEKELDAQHRYQLASEAYQYEMTAYGLWKAEHDLKSLAQQRLAMQIVGLPTVEDQLRRCEAYDRDLAVYEAAKVAYDALQVEVGDKRAEMMGWRAARAALGEIRARIKTHLVPALSKVASALLRSMTDGQRASVVVDENFDVMVDGQRLETLSGSGKAIANLALRIALGQVLTNRVVSLFVGDEIDASMDDVRAAATHSSIRSLSGQILQILLVSHKLPVADAVITMGSGNNEYRRSADAA